MPPQEVAKRANKYYCIRLTEARRLIDSLTTLAHLRCSCRRRRRLVQITVAVFLAWHVVSSLCAILGGCQRILCARTMHKRTRTHKHKIH